MTFNLQVLLLFCVLSKSYGQLLQNLVEEVTWKKIEYQFPTQDIRDEAIANGDYDPEKMNFPLDADVYYGDNNERTIFVTLPRSYPGAPITLGVVTDRKAEGGPEIRAYPNYDLQDAHGRDCDKITSVYRIKIDSCGRLWAIDSGTVGRDYGASGYEQMCSPSLWAFDAKTGQVLVHYEFPGNQVEYNSLFVTVEVDVRNPYPNDCNQTMVYVADTLGSGLIVYDLNHDVSWRIENDLFRPDSDFEEFKIEGTSFELRDGIMGLAVYPPPPKTNSDNADHQERRLYFQSLSSDKLNSVSLSVIDDRQKWEDDSSASPDEFHVLGQRGSQSGPLAVSRNGRLFFGEVPHSISSWSTRNEKYEPSNIHEEESDSERLQFIGGTKIIRNKVGRESVWVVSNRAQLYYGGSYNENETNFRILSMRIKILGIV